MEVEKYVYLLKYILNVFYVQGNLPCMCVYVCVCLYVHLAM